ncbi:hypothetical protein [Streptomyces sp. NPDC048623]|uniref:hypothetical protein n=1 Tax=Streptomyces sp. NPDC048623 TaxID=3155761 RepID=UPI0034478D4B
MWTALVLSVAAAGTGCTPGPQAVVAVQGDGSGGVKLLLARCPDYRINSVSVFADAVVEGNVKSWAVSNDKFQPTPEEVHPFEVPRGWEAYETALSTLEDGTPYVARTAGSIGGRGSGGRGEVPTKGAERIR